MKKTCYLLAVAVLLLIAGGSPVSPQGQNQYPIADKVGRRSHREISDIKLQTIGRQEARATTIRPRCRDEAEGNHVSQTGCADAPVLFGKLPVPLPTSCLNAG